MTELKQELLQLLEVVSSTFQEFSALRAEVRKVQHLACLVCSKGRQVLVLVQVGMFFVLTM